MTTSARSTRGDGEDSRRRRARTSGGHGGTAGSMSSRSSAGGGAASKGKAPPLWIEHPDQLREARPGQTLATRSHEVIRHWASARHAEPVAAPTTPRAQRPRALRLQFPDFVDGRLEPLGWDEWLGAFDERGLVFQFQERLKNGGQSNFFRLENPPREES